jgi:hypothetical protein
MPRSPDAGQPVEGAQGPPWALPICAGRRVPWLLPLVVPVVVLGAVAVAAGAVVVGTAPVPSACPLWQSRRARRHLLPFSPGDLVGARGLVLVCVGIHGVSLSVHGLSRHMCSAQAGGYHVRE